jgi:hypothetical protein
MKQNDFPQQHSSHKADAKVERCIKSLLYYMIDCSNCYIVTAASVTAANCAVSCGSAHSVAAVAAVQRCVYSVRCEVAMYIYIYIYIIVVMASHK